MRLLAGSLPCTALHVEKACSNLFAFQVLSNYSLFRIVFSSPEHLVFFTAGL
jgi:hypothetical protein